MKKTVLGMVFLGTCCAALAQNTQTTNNTSTTNSANTTMPTDLNSAKATNNSTDNAILQSSGNYSAYGPAVNVSSSTQMAFTRDYPTATNVNWQQNNEWTRASYRTGARNMNVYYSANGSSYAVALPVVQGYVAEEVIGKALDQYGDRLYSITRLKAANGQDAYQVTLTQNGQSSTEWISEDGSAVMNVYRTNEESNEGMSTTTTTGTTTTDNGPNAGDVMEGEDLYYSSMSTDEDYTTSYEEQTEWTTTAADTATSVNDGTTDDEDKSPDTTMANDEAIMNEEE